MVVAAFGDYGTVCNGTVHRYDGPPCLKAHSWASAAPASFTASFSTLDTVKRTARRAGSMSTSWVWTLKNWRLGFTSLVNLPKCGTVTLKTNANNYTRGDRCSNCWLSCDDAPLPIHKTACNRIKNTVPNSFHAAGGFTGFCGHRFKQQVFAEVLRSFGLVICVVGE